MTFRRAATMAVVLLIPAGATVVPGQDRGKGDTASKQANKTQPNKPGDSKPGSKQYTPEQIIDAFEQDRPVNRPATRRHGSGRVSVSPNPAKNLRRDGEYVTNVTGRISQEGEWWFFTFKSDSTTLELAPVRLLPNQQLERIVREQKSTSEQISFVISGEMTVFSNENYLLLRKALRQLDMGNIQE